MVAKLFGSMEGLYHQTNQLIDEVHNCFSRLERGSNIEAHSLENEIQIRIDRITSHCEKLEILANKEPQHRRQNSRTRVEQLKYDCQHLQASLRSVQHRRLTKEQELQDREELLSRKFTTNDHDTSILIDHSLQHNSQLKTSHREMDDLLGSGSSLLGNLRDQRGTLKGAHRKIMDVANSLGLSNTVMRLIEKRAHQDKYILFGGMLFTCIIMIVVIKYLL